MSFQVVQQVEAAFAVIRRSVWGIAVGMHAGFSTQGKDFQPGIICQGWESACVRVDLRFQLGIAKITG